MYIVLTIVGRDRVGIIARMSAILAEHQVNIISINQSILDGFFNMVLIGDMEKATISVKDLNAEAAALGEELGLEIRVQSEAIFEAMHRI